MNSYQVCMLTVLITTVLGCTNIRQDLSSNAFSEPVTIDLGAPDSPPLTPVRIHSGQLIAIPLCCPPLELRGTDGKMIHELEYTQKPQALVAPAGTYSVVGHDPRGKEWVRKLEVVNR